MESPALRRPLWLAAASLMGWLMCTVLVVSFDGDSNREQWVNVAGAALASAFAAGVLGGGVLGWWQGREQKRTPRRIAFLEVRRCADKLDELVKRVADVRDGMWRCSNIVEHARFGTRAPAPAAYPSGGLIAVPLTELRNALIKETASTFEEARLRLGSDPDWSQLTRFASYDADRAIQALAELRDHVGSLVARLAAVGLVDAVRHSDLELRMESLSRRGPHLAAIRDHDAIGLAMWNLIVEASRELAQALGEVYRSVAAQSKDPWIQQQVHRDRRRSSALDTYLELRRSAEREMKDEDLALGSGPN